MIKLKDYTLSEIKEDENFFSLFNGTFSDGQDVTCKDLEFVLNHNTTEEEISIKFVAYVGGDYDSEPYELEINLGEYIKSFIELASDIERASAMTVKDFIDWIIEEFVGTSIKLIIEKENFVKEVYLFDLKGLLVSTAHIKSLAKNISNTVSYVYPKMRTLPEGETKDNLKKSMNEKLEKQIATNDAFVCYLDNNEIEIVSFSQYLEMILQ